MTAFGHKKKFLAASTDAFVQIFLPEDYESLTENADGVFTYYYKSIDGVLDSMNKTVHKFYKLSEQNVDIYQLAYPNKLVLAQLNKTEVADQTDKFLVLTTKLRKRDLRAMLADDKGAVRGVTRIAKYGRDDAVHALGDIEEFHEILNETHPFGRLLNPGMDREELRYNFDRLVSSEIEFSVETLDTNPMIINRKTPHVECLTWTVRLRYNFNLRSSLLPLQIRYNYAGCNEQVDKAYQARKPYFWFALILAICALVSGVLTLRVMIIRGRLWAKHRRELGKKIVSIYQLPQVYVGWWYFVMILRDVLNVLGAVFIVFVRDREGPKSSRESINIANDFLSGLGGLLSCLCVIRYLQFNAKFYVLILTLQKGLPDVIRFCCGVFPLFVAYVLSGTTWFGHYVRAFQTLDETSVTLFSSIAGDQMRETYDMISGFNRFFKLVGRIYLTSFIVLFVYSVLNIFLVIVGEAYSLLRQQIEEGLRQERMEIARKHVKEQEEMNLYKSAHGTTGADHVGSDIEIDENSVEQQYVVSLTDAILQKIKDQQNGVINSEQSALLADLESIALQLVRGRPLEDRKTAATKTAVKKLELRTSFSIPSDGEGGNDSDSSDDARNKNNVGYVPPVLPPSSNEEE